LEEKKGVVNVSVANLYHEGTYHSEIVSQALLGEKLLIKQEERDFCLIEMPDGYPGWISNYQWVADALNESETMMIRTHFAPVFLEANENTKRIRDATLGNKLHVCDHRDGWIQVQLPDGVKGWIEESKFGPSSPGGRSTAVNLAKELLGYPYFWGGRSTKGFDCSGLMQRIFSLLDIALPRDAWMQHRDSTFIVDKPNAAQPGDLLFFAENGSKITHVGLALGNSRMIHARGYVRMNSLNPGDEGYNAELETTFVDARSVF